MISFEKAYEIVKGSNLKMQAERVDLLLSLNRVLTEDVFSDINIPPFNKSAMDGFACRKIDLKNELEVVEEIPAGKVPEKIIGPNQCARIMTGGMVPEGADFVIQLEHIQQISSISVKRVKESSSSNICYIGEDIKLNEKVLQKGERILPQHIAILASAGVTNPLVNSLPLVAVISTGNELVEPQEKPIQSKIRNSNAYQLMSQTSMLGYNPEYLGIVSDNEADLYKTLLPSINKYNVVLISGGVSVGDYDFVPKVLKQLQVEIIFHGIEAKPGKHLLFGKKDNCLIFGLPGNPVSSFIQFEVLIKPLLVKLIGKSGKSELFQLPMGEDYQRKKADTISFIPGMFSESNSVLPVEYHGSAHIHSYSNANCIIEIPQGLTSIKKGEMVNVRPL